MAGGQALFAFWVFGQEPMNRRRERGRGSLGEAPSKKDGLTKSAHLGRGRNGSSRHFNFFWNAVSSPPRAVNKLRAGARGANTSDSDKC